MSDEELKERAEKYADEYQYGGGIARAAIVQTYIDATKSILEGQRCIDTVINIIQKQKYKQPESQSRLFHNKRNG